MGPVSFQRILGHLDRDGLLAAARRLTAAGIRVQSVDEGQGLLLRAEDAVRAGGILAASEDEDQPAP
ncbi:MAG: hypothetical protein AAF547_17680 [Actinomycetota bacterium]